MSETRNDNTATAAPLMFVAGLALGSVVGALLTPRSGTEMRQDIKRKAERVKEGLKDTANSVRNKAEENVDKAQEQIDTISNRMSREAPKKR